MECRLDILVNYLRDNNFEKEYIDELIVKYYSDRDSQNFEIQGSLYSVMTNYEKNDTLYEIAENRYFDILCLMEEKLENPLFLKLLNAIDEDSGIDIVCEGLDYCKEFECEELYSNNGYIIYRIN